MHQFLWVSVLERIHVWVSGANGKWWLKNMDTYLYFFSDIFLTYEHILMDDTMVQWLVLLHYSKKVVGLISDLDFFVFVFLSLRVLPVSAEFSPGRPTS